ncbi:B12-binding domain-containing radical SAM protein [Patescibacteria group bacterium]
MSKILFIQQEAAEKFGTMILSAVLKKAGHKVEVFVELMEKETVFDYVKRWQPDLIAFSITTIEKDWAISLASKIKNKHQVFSVFGGAEPTYSPEMIKHPAVDFICRGEGDKSFLELVSRLEKKKSLKGVKNFWVKEKGQVIKNKLAPLIASLDDLPLPDREIYYKYSLLRNLSTKKFLCSRGCPYDCTYCSNHAYLKLFKGQGKYLRYRKPQLVINEIKQVKKKYGLKRVYLADESLTTNRTWLLELLKIYRREIKLPFSCLARVNELDEKMIKALKVSGCFYVAFGVESGSDRIRNKILKRNMKEVDILRVAQLMRKHKLPFLTHQMYVLPTETLEEAFKTVELNIKMRSDSVWDTIFQPLPNNEIYQFCQRKKLLPKKLKVDSMFGKSKIKNPDKRQIENLRKLVWLNIRLPFLLPLTKKLVYLPNNLIFELILKVSEAYSIYRRWRLSPWEMIRLAWGTGKKLG